MKITRLIASVAATVFLAGSLAGCGLIPLVRNQGSSTSSGTSKNTEAAMDSPDSSAASGSTGGGAFPALPSAPGKGSQTPSATPTASSRSVQAMGPIVSNVPEKAPIAPRGWEPMFTPQREKFSGIDQPTVDGAMATINYFLSARYYAYATGDTSLLKSTMATQCKNCAGLLDYIDTRVRVNKLYFWGGYPEIGFSEIKEPLRDGQVGLRYNFAVSPAHTWSPNADKASTYIDDSEPELARLVYNGQQWLVVDYGAAP